MAPEERIIIHLDMDAFFAAVEELDRPGLRGRPVVVGADPKGGRGRGVVSTCSYAARRYGIHSAQPISEAYRRCPHAVFLPVRGGRYSEVSRQIREILEEFTPHIEPVSIDEAFLDVSGAAHLFGGKYELPVRIKRSVRKKTGLTASLGVAPNKMLAKIASDLDKPDGLVIVEDDEIETFLHPLPVDKLWGVGPKTEAVLASMGLRSVGDVARTPLRTMQERLGEHGRHLHRLALGIDHRPVKNVGEIKSIGHEHTFDEDTGDGKLIENKIMFLCEKVAFRLRKSGLKARAVSTKIRLDDFQTRTRSSSPDEPVGSAHEIFAAALANLKRLDRHGRKVRLVGVTATMLERNAAVQTGLFDRDAGNRSAREKWERLERTVSEIQAKHGAGALKRGSSIGHNGSPSGRSGA